MRIRHGRATVTAIGGSQTSIAVPLSEWTRNPEVKKHMSHTSSVQSQLSVIPLKDILPWATVAGLLSLIAIYFVSSEQGGIAVFDGTNVHEFVHDARHLLGFPCH